MTMPFSANMAHESIARPRTQKRRYGALRCLLGSPVGIDPDGGGIRRRPSRRHGRRTEGEQHDHQKSFHRMSPQGAPLPSMRAPAACTDVVGTTAIDAEKSIINRIMKRMFHLAPASSRDDGSARRAFSRITSSQPRRKSCPAAICLATWRLLLPRRCSGSAVVVDP